MGFLSEEESRGYNFLHNHIKGTVQKVPCSEKGKISAEVLNSSTKVTGSFKNDKPSIHVQVELEQNIAEISCPLDLTKPETIDTLNKETSKLVQANLEQTFHTIQKTYQVDILKFSEVLHREDHQAWKRIKKDWATLYPNLPVHIEVKVKTKGIGTARKLKVG